MSKKHRPITVGRVMGVLRYVPLVLWVVFWVVALGWIVMASFSTTKEIFTDNLLGSGWHIENYINSWQRNNFGRYNSIVITSISCVLIILISSPAAYVLAKKTFIGKKLVMNSFVLALSVPQVMLVIPIYVQFIKMGMIGHLYSLIILYVAFNIPYTIFFLTSFISTIPKELAEAAMIDGCSEGKAMWKVMMPMATPGIITVTIFNFMGIWNEYFIALIFANGNDKIRTLSMGMQSIVTAMKYTGDWAGLFASVMILFTPTFILYLFLSDKIVSGITGGGVKG